MGHAKFVLTTFIVEICGNEDTKYDVYVQDTWASNSFQDQHDLHQSFQTLKVAAWNGHHYSQ